MGRVVISESGGFRVGVGCCGVGPSERVSHGAALPKHTVAQRQWRPEVVDQLRSAMWVRATFFRRFHTHVPERVQLQQKQTTGPLKTPVPMVVQRLLSGPFTRPYRNSVRGRRGGPISKLFFAHLGYCGMHGAQIRR